jgi:hypothetical protein
MGYNTTTGQFDVYDATGWSSLLDSGTAVTVAQGGTGRTTTLAQASLVLTTNSASFAENTYQKVPFDSATFDNKSGFASNQYTIQVAGQYTITTTAYIRQTSGGLPNQWLVKIYKNGADLAVSEADGNSIYFTSFTLTTSWNGTLAVNDVISVFGYHSLGSGANQARFIANSCTINIQQLS